MKSHDCRVDLLLVALLSLLWVVVVLLVLSSAACVGCHHLSLQAGDGGVLFTCQTAVGIGCGRCHL